MDYGEVLSRSWKFVWKFKALWLFGLFAACGASRGPNFNFDNSFRTSGNGVSGAPPSLPPSVQLALRRLALLFDDPAFIWTFLGVALSVICVIALIQIALGVMGRIGLIKGAAQADTGAERLIFGALWKESTPYFWRMFWLTILIGGPFAVLAITIAAGFIASLIPLVGNRPDIAAFLVLFTVLFGLLCVLLLFAIIIGLISRQAERAIVIENASVLDSLRRGWEIFTKNLGPILIIWIIQSAISIAVGILIALPLLVILIPAMIVFLSNTNGVNVSLAPWLIVISIIILVYVLVAWFVNGILTAYLESVWTLTFLRLTKPKRDNQTVTVLPANA